ncbi:hypothetical protein MTR67_019377 [Solanum verrucosum]|uniref:Gag-pol polyprotein n=1 Tax=Solanum verrucosum TaxID=315347 RepID=A0AAF0QLE9_SOLVR|nr:hypothetical protein MTR67_019377 [Solanum verrucosum]
MEAEEMTEADVSDVVITNTILVCDRMATTLFDSGSTYSYVSFQFALGFYATWADLVILDMTDFDIILGMTWLSLYYAVLNYNAKSVTLEIPGRKKLEWEGVYKPKPAKVVDAESPSVESEFKEVFPTDLFSMPPDRDINFCIDLELGTRPHLHSPLSHGLCRIERA